MPMPLSIGSFEPLPWVNEYTQTAMPIQGEVVAPILYFSLMWNLFERDTCKKEATRNNIEKAVTRAFGAGMLTLQPFEEHLAYFRHRAHRGDMSVEQYLDALKMINEKDRHLVGAVLSGSTEDPRKVVHALLLVALRIRNNLFHGEKEVAYLHSQVDLFQAVNSLLATYLTVTKSAA